MNLSSISCSFPNCDCPGQKVYRGARAIAKRIWGDEKFYRRVFCTKGLPVVRIGTTLHLFECFWLAYLREKTGK